MIKARATDIRTMATAIIMGTQATPVIRAATTGAARPST
jgi:hypothetical protein